MAVSNFGESPLTGNCLTMKKLIKSVALAVYGELKRDGMRNGFTRIALFALLTFGGFVGLGTNQSSASTYLYTFTSPLYGSGYIDFTVNNTGLVTSASGQFTSTIDPATYSGPITIDTTVSGATVLSRSWLEMRVA